MAVKHEILSIGTSATNLFGSLSDGTNKAYDENAVARTIVLTNESSVTVYIGGSAVTTSAYGLKLGAGERVSLDLAYHDFVYGVVATGTASVAVLLLGA